MVKFRLLMQVGQHYHILFHENQGPHPVWGRLPATAIAMNHFPNAEILLYIDTDAMLSNGKYTPTSMYEALVDKYQTNATLRNTKPSLIVNKPMKGWLCKLQCDPFGLGHGCFNSGALLWRRSKGAAAVLKAWWESRLDNGTQNFYHDTKGWFEGWDISSNHRYGHKMSEQNRLMHVYHTNPDARRRILPVPKQLGAKTNSSSCPELVDGNHTPCLQNDNESHNAKWNRRGLTCFINHYANTKDVVYKVSNLVLHPRVRRDTPLPAMINLTRSLELFHDNKVP